MRSSSRIDPRLHKLENEMQLLIGPFVNKPNHLPADPQNQSNESWTLLDHLEYVFHVNLELLVNLHTLPDSDQEIIRKPTVRGHLVLLTGIMTSNIDQQMADYEPGHIDRNRDYAWLREHFQFWNDKLAGLYFLPVGWQDKVLNKEHPALGYLSGSDWLRIMYLFTRFHRKFVEKIQS